MLTCEVRLIRGLGKRGWSLGDGRVRLDRGCWLGCGGGRVRLVGFGVFRRGLGLGLRRGLLGFSGISCGFT